MAFHIILFIQSIRKKIYKLVYTLSSGHLKCVQLSEERPIGFMIYQPLHFMPTRQ